MNILPYIAFFSVLVCYGGAAALYWRSLLVENEKKSSLAPVIRNTGIVLHVVFLLVLGIKYQELPLINIANVLTTLAFALVLVHSITEVLSAVSGTGAFVMGMATLLHLLGWTSITSYPEKTSELLQSPIFGLHVLFAVCGYAGFILSALYGVMYLIQFRSLKSMRFGPLFRNLPALDFLGRMNFVGASVGFVCLTAAILMGLTLATRVPNFSAGDAKFIQTLTAWFVYGCLLAGKVQLGWQGKRLVYLSLVSFLLFAGSALVVNTFFSSFHRFS